MRLLSRAVLVAATVLVAPTLHAQTSISVAAGATLPMGDFADGSEMGYNATLGLGIKPPLAPIGFRAEGMFNSLAAKGASDVSTRILAGIANITISGAAMAVPMGYIIGGLGMYNLGCSGCGPLFESSNEVGINFGAGLNIPLTGFGTFAEARLHIIMAEGGNRSMLPITFGIKF